jgi:hypothetical protein
MGQSPDGKERDQAVRYAAEDDQQQCGKADQGHDAMGIKQPAAADLEHVRQVVVHGDRVRETGKSAYEVFAESASTARSNRW